MAITPTFSTQRKCVAPVEVESEKVWSIVFLTAIVNSQTDTVGSAAISAY